MSIRNELLEQILAAINDGAALGPQLVVNGGFNVDAGWVKGAGWTIAGGVASNDGTAGAIGQAISIIGGVMYRIEFDTSNGTYSSELSVQLGGVNADTVSSDGSHSFDVVAGGGVAAIDFFCVALNDFIGDVDNVSVREIL